jgi:hypothetical protein
MTAATGHLGVLTNCTYAHLIPGREGWVLRTWGGGAESVATASAGQSDSLAGHSAWQVTQPDGPDSLTIAAV